MNEVIRQLFERKSVRGYTGQEISKEEKELILTAAAQAPTAGNQLFYTILDITDQKIKDRLAVTCDSQPFIAEAKMVLIFCADCRKWYEAFREAGCDPRKPDAGDFLIAFSDANIAAQNAVVAAHSLGIGSCYIGDVLERYEEHADLLSLPEYVFPAAMLVFGYPMQQQKDRKKPERTDLKYLVHENGYRKQDPREMFAYKSRDFDAWMRKFCSWKYQSDFSLEMSRSVRAFLDTLGK